jgi:nitric oxide reductase NorD protein
VTVSDSGSPNRFRFLATFLAGRPLSVTEAPTGEAAYTDGRFVFVSAGRSISEQRREVFVQGALLGAGSLDHRLVRALRGRPNAARRYLALEGHRVFADLAPRLPLAAALRPTGEPTTSTADESLEVARGRRRVEAPPQWFGVIRPSRLLGAPACGPSAQASDGDLRLEFDPTDVPETQGDEDAERGEESKILRLFGNPLASNTLSDLFNKLLGSSRSPGDGPAGGEMPVRSMRRVDRTGPNARPLPVRLRFTTNGRPGSALGVGGALYPEWDVHHNRYRLEHCRVIDFTLSSTPDISDVMVQRDEVLRRRLSRLGLGPKVLRRRPDGDDLDIEALIDLFVDLRSGYSPPEHIYLERRKLARNLGVLILLDASGSATDTDPDGGLSVHDHQRRAAATLALTLEDLGDRVAVYGFRSHGRSAVHLPAIKPFGQRSSARSRARLNQLQPAGYTRLGAGIRGAGEILKTGAGTPNRLLVVLSDGFPYDDGYEARYAEADAHKALEELRTDGVACLCLSIGTSTPSDALHRVFGSASHANAPTLADLSPRMDELFLAALKELAAPKLRGPRRARTRA